MAVRITDGTDTLLINTAGAAEVTTTTDDSLSGFTCLASEIDPGEITASRRVKALEASEDYRLRVGLDTVLLSETFPGAAINTGTWTSPATTATITVAAGFLNLNAAGSLASGAVARVSSNRGFSMFGSFGTYWECLAQFPQTPVTNNVTEWGMGIATGVAVPTDGCIFRMNATGEFRAVCIANSVEVQSGTLDFSALVGTNTTRRFTINITEDVALFWIDDVLVAAVARPTGGYGVTASNNLPVLLRTYNSAVTGSAQVPKFGWVGVSMADMNCTKPFPALMSGMGGHGSQGQTGGTMGSTAQVTNSADPAAGTPTNTTAALGTGLGGIFLANAQATAVTDFIISSYQVPVGTAALPGRTLTIHGVNIDVVNTVVAVAGTPTTISYFLCYGHSAVSLATAEAATTKAPRRIPLGCVTFPVGAAVGAMPTNGGIDRQFTAPVTVEQGGFVAIVARFVTGTATATEVFKHYIGFDSNWE